MLFALFYDELEILRKRKLQFLFDELRKWIKFVWNTSGRNYTSYSAFSWTEYIFKSQKFLQLDEETLTEDEQVECWQNSSRRKY